MSIESLTGFLIEFLIAAISMGTIYLYGCIGETVTEKVGSLNLGIPGIMCIGAVGGCLAVSWFQNVENPSGFLMVLLAILFSMIFAGLAGLLFAFLTVTLHGNQNVTGLAMTTFGIGFMRFFAKRIFDSVFFSNSSAFFKNFFGEDAASSDNPLVRIFLSHGVLVYLGIIIAVGAQFFLRRTRIGMNLRSIGEMPSTADAAGINVTLYKYVFITVGSAIAGLSGLYYVMDRSGGTTFAEAQIDAFGWMAIALVIAATWKPIIAIFGSFLFGGLYILPAKLPLSDQQSKALSIIPYAITVIVLIITSIINKPENQPPASLGINYYREDR